jgi:putative nucleotidyltransferase with HDIG domain
VRAGFWVALSTGTVLAILLTIQLLPDRVSLKLGQAAPEDIIAHRTVRFLDEHETERLRAEAAAAVPKRYALDPNAAAEAERDARRFFVVARQVRAARAKGSARPSAPLPEAELAPALRDGPLKMAVTLEQKTLDRLAVQTASVVRRLMTEPIKNDTDDLSRLRRRIPGEVAAFSLPPAEHALVGTVASAALRANRRFELAATVEERRRAQEAVEPYYRQVNRGEVIIPRGQRVRQEHLDQLQALGLRRPHVDLATALCLALIAFGMVALTGFYLYHFHRHVYRQRAALWLLAIITVATVLLFRLGASALGLKLSGTQLGYVGVIFSATAAMLVAVLVQPQVGVFVGAMMAVLAGLIVNNELRFSILALVSSVVGAAVVSNIRDRAGLLRAALYVAAANVVTSALVSGVASPDAWAELATGTAWGVIGGFMSAFLFALGATLLERPFGVTTHLTLLELSDPNKPLLKRLAMEAPGTYAHSIMVGNLAEAAAEAIGADALFARVASYYHDIGKIFRPQFFVENQQSGNRHDTITPTLSRLVVTSHVKDGVELAEQYRLPPPIIDIIKEHHGTCLMRYFYHQAVTSAAESLPTGLEYQFRYAGPRPRTKESGIIMIADAAEAASRTLEKPTPGRIRELVERIVQERLADGQLDDCELTFKDLERVIASFTRTLAGSLHARIDYPDVLAPRAERREAREEKPAALAETPEPLAWGQASHGVAGEESTVAAPEIAAAAEADRPPGRDAVGS